MKRAIVIILIMILVAGGGAGGLIMLGIVPNPFNPHMPEAPMTKAEKAAAELAAKTKFKPPLSAFVLIKMEDMVFPVIIGGRVQRRVLLTARVMASSSTSEAYIKDNMPLLQSEVIKDLVPYFQDYFQSHDMLDVVALKGKLVKHAKAVFDDRVKDVLLINAFETSTGRAMN